MEVFGYDITLLFTWEIVIFMLLGTFVGMVCGALPGLGVITAIVLLFPITYTISPLAAILMLLAAYQSADYAGSIASITLAIPGTPQAAATILDGRPLALKESAGKALSYSLTSSTVGGLVGGLVLIFLSKPLANFALKISAPEFFLIGVLGLLAVGMLSSENKVNSMISVILGLMFGTVGLDRMTGVGRMTYGQMHIMDGINLVALLVGVFAVSEIFNMVKEGLNKTHADTKTKIKTGLTWKEWKGTIKPNAIGSTIGGIVGIFPGLGATAASWVAYAVSKKFSKHPETYGSGNPEGIVAPESANNSVVGGAMAPMLALGIPGSASIAIIMGAFIVHGIRPGPNVFLTNPDLVNGIFYGFLLTTIAMYFVGRFVTSAFARILMVPNSFLAPIVFVLCLAGVFLTKQSFFDLWFLLIIGIIFFFLKELDFSLPAVVLAFVLSPIIEDSLRRTLILSRGDYSVFVTRPISLTIVLILVGIVGFGVYNAIRKRKKKPLPSPT